MAQYKVLVSDKLSDAGLEILRKHAELEVDYKPGLSEADLADAIGAYDGLVIRSGSKVTAKVLEKASKLKVVGRAGIGVDNVDVPAASKRGVVVMNTPTGNAVTTAEHAITLLLSLARKIPQATASMRQGKWEKTKFQGREVTDKTLGIIGLGNIGRIVADRAQGLKMNVIAFDPVMSADKAAQLGVECVSLDELFRRADFITIHAPLTSDTKMLINDAAFDKMKKGVLLVNAARGGIVDEQALLRALEQGKVAGAALDVFEQEPAPADHPLFKHENFVCTPHLGASTDEAQERVALEIAEQVAAFLLHGVVRNAVNVPSVSKEHADKLEPYVVLGGKIGRLLGQLWAQGAHGHKAPLEVREVRVTCTGEASEYGVRPIAYAALAGYLERYLEEPVNAVSAPFQAKERGLALTEIRGESGKGYANTVRVELVGAPVSHGSQGSQPEGATYRCAEGTLTASGEPRLIALDDYELDAVLDGTTLVLRNEDRPGVIGAVGSILGAQGINVSRMQVGLDKTSKQAVALWNVDSNPTGPALDELKKLPNIRSVFCVQL
jgi:D-3-phosphoglycerate dehydrogenase